MTGLDYPGRAVHFWPHVVTRWARYDGYMWHRLQRWIHQWMDATEGCSGWSRERSCSRRSEENARVEGLSVRALAARHKVHRRTVRQALESAARP